MKVTDIIQESKLGVEPKRSARTGSRPDRGHEPVQRYKTTVDEGVVNMAELAARVRDMLDKGMTPQQIIATLNKENIPSYLAQQAIKLAQVSEGQDLDEHGKASRALCTSSKPDSELGASMLASCKSQGLRARDGNKSHKLGKTSKSRVKVGGHRIKGHKYGGPLPDWS